MSWLLRLLQLLSGYCHAHHCHCCTHSSPPSPAPLESSLQLLDISHSNTGRTDAPHCSGMAWLRRGRLCGLRALQGRRRRGLTCECVQICGSEVSKQKLLLTISGSGALCCHARVCYSKRAKTSGNDSGNLLS